jgi:cholesterol oxidase
MIEPLSSSIDTMQGHYDVVVIGSGYGGSIAASRLARAGKTVCVLERGDERQPGSYPNSGHGMLQNVQLDTPIAHVGAKTAMIDVRYNKDINVVVGCGLGGTSLINAGIGLRPAADALNTDAWPVELRPEAALDAYFARAESMLKPSVAPRQFQEAGKATALAAAATKLGKIAAPLPVLVNFDRLPNDTNHVGVTQFPCVGCGDCVTGCNYRAKNTLIMNYLPDAKNHSAEIFVRARVRHLEKADGEWHVFGQSVNENGDETPFRVSGTVVILAAGTLGSTEILLRCRDSGLQLSAQVGNHFSTNGDTIGFAYNTDREVGSVGLGARKPDPNAPVGTTATAMVDFRADPGADAGFLLQEAAIPGAAADFLAPMFAAEARLKGTHQDESLLDEVRKKYLELESKLLGPYTGAVKHTLSLILLAYDDSMGRMSLQDDRLRIDWPGLGDQVQFKQASALLQRVTSALNGEYIPNPIWNDLTDHNLATAHPLGGCVLADSPECGAVNHKGQVFTGDPDGSIHQGLYVMDGSVIPTSLGVNPLLTISGLAERSVYLLAQDYGWSIEYGERPVNVVA